MVLLDVRGKIYKNKNVNRVEIESCIATIKYILKYDKGKEKPSIAVITPFKEQKAEIESKLKKEKIENVKVGTVHAFQGQERDYIIFSQVLDSLTKRSSLGFIGRKCNMLNVAVTRAKKQFIFLGNMDVATKIKNYSTKLVNYIQNNGVVYSLYDTENKVSENNWNKEILKVLQSELNLGSDKIGMYINKFIESGVIFDAKQHYDFLKYVIENAESEIYIMSPWFNSNVMDDVFFESIKRLKEINCKIRIYFGYKKGNANIIEAKELVQELKRSNSLGFAKEDVAEDIINKMYQLIGKEGFVYAPPTHAKVLIIDDKYMCMGSHNWLSNAGKSPQNQRATEGSIITTSLDAISYVKEEILNNSIDYKRKNEYNKM